MSVWKEKETGRGVMEVTALQRAACTKDVVKQQWPGDRCDAGFCKGPMWSVGLSTSLLTNSKMLVLNKSMNERMAKRERHEPKATWVLHSEGLSIPGLYQHVGGTLSFCSECWFSQIKECVIRSQRYTAGGLWFWGFFFPILLHSFQNDYKFIKNRNPLREAGMSQQAGKNTGVKKMWGRRGRGGGRRDRREKRGRQHMPAHKHSSTHTSAVRLWEQPKHATFLRGHKSLFTQLQHRLLVRVNA